MKSYNLAIIGLGQIGQRHLQSILKINFKISLYLYELDIEILNFIKRNYKIKKSINIFYNSKIESMEKIIDILIISTTANVRLKVLNNFLKKNTIKNIIFEKPVTSNLLEYKKIVRLLNKNKINSFINFPRRMFTVYNQIRNLIDNKKKLKIQFHGKKWNMASNLIHFLDLLSFLTGNKNIYLSHQNLHKRIYKSKRKNFIEFKGGLEFYDNNKNTLFITDNTKYIKSEYILIEQENIKFYIYETKHKLITEKNLNKNNKKISKIKIPLQSQLSKNLIKKIIFKEHTNLPSVQESYNNHKIIIKTFNEHINSLTNMSELNIT